MLDIKVIGEGSFGKIVQVNTETFSCVLKKVEYEIRYNNIKIIMANSLREILFLQMLDHPNIIKPFKFTPRFIYMNNEGNTLRKSLLMTNEVKIPELTNPFISKNMNNPFSGIPIPITGIRNIFWQLLLGLDYIHNNGIIHSDIKPQNILYDTKTRIVKICDFNFATFDDGSISGKNTYTTQYRPLETFFSNYNSKSDIWALACTICEFINERPLFNIKIPEDRSKINTILFNEIVSTLGYPKPEIIEKYKLTELMKHKLKPKRTNIICREKCVDYEILTEILESMLNYDADLRPSCREIMQHKYFRDAGYKFEEYDLPSIKILNINIPAFEIVNNQKIVNKQIIIDNIYQKILSFMDSNENSSKINKWISDCFTSFLFAKKELDYYNPPNELYDCRAAIEEMDFGLIVQDILFVN